MELAIAVEKPNKHELRTRETRERLLQAAEKIFVRDGYEAAELGEIATLAGRTKGAIYAQFESKEDIFLALIESRAVQYRTEMHELLAASTSVEQNQKAFRQFGLKISEDQSWLLLLLEFKLFAIRHPEAKKRYRDFLVSRISIKQENRLSQILGPAGNGKDALSRFLAVHMLQPLLSAIAVESQLDPDLVKEETRKKLFGRIFDSLFRTSSEK
jgi:AcrR family transcriptional regulator